MDKCKLKMMFEAIIVSPAQPRPPAEAIPVSSGSWAFPCLPRQTVRAETSEAKIASLANQVWHHGHELYVIREAQWLANILFTTTTHVAFSLQCRFGLVDQSAVEDLLRWRQSHNLWRGPAETPGGLLGSLAHALVLFRSGPSRVNLS
ncbi:uncharacterized protein CLUP02_08636 [Colletotrichum lupini]|uniref:Uncharacterized protein n=1 Tax=Colletotrichum lupini TaxID=145971 RepID=A0A9Q8STG0_9PEZI|nr:uncharacterized protein CLUP02_08636 [Colletotrichum lupini]UQC83143.1 hypothetical protein CLUP02_08636 [Colletotrichum lupini]